MGERRAHRPPAPTCQPQVKVPLQRDSVPTPPLSGGGECGGGGERAAGDCLPLNARADLSVFQDVDVGVEKPRREGGVMARPEGALIWTRSQAPHSPKSPSSLLLLAAGPTPAGLRVPA